MRAASSPMEPLNKNILLAGEVIAEKWKIGEKIGEGTFSQIYSAYSIESRDKVAVKVEAPSSLKPVLEWESLILKSLQDCPYVCRYYYHGKHGDSTVLVMELLGESMSMLRMSPDSIHGVPLAKAVSVGLEMLDCIEAFHRHGYVHRDIKASNFALSAVSERNPTKPQRYYIIDFGLSRQHLGEERQVLPARQVAEFRGTSMYASLSSHRRQELGPKDDLWSWFYLVMDFLRGELPWAADAQLKNRQTVLRLKEHYTEASPNLLVENLPGATQLLEMMEYLQSLKYQDIPDYKHIRKQLQAVKQRTLVFENSDSGDDEASVDKKEARMVADIDAVNWNSFESMREKALCWVEKAEAYTNNDGALNRLLTIAKRHETFFFCEGLSFQEQIRVQNAVYLIEKTSRGRGSVFAPPPIQSFVKRRQSEQKLRSDALRKRRERDLQVRQSLDVSKEERTPKTASTIGSSGTAAGGDKTKEDGNKGGSCPPVKSESSMDVSDAEAIDTSVSQRHDLMTASQPYFQQSHVKLVSQGPPLHHRSRGSHVSGSIPPASSPRIPSSRIMTYGPERPSLPPPKPPGRYLANSKVISPSRNHVPFEIQHANSAPRNGNLEQHASRQQYDTAAESSSLNSYQRSQFSENQASNGRCTEMKGGRRYIDERLPASDRRYESMRKTRDDPVYSSSQRPHDDRIEIREDRGYSAYPRPQKSPREDTKAQLDRYYNASIEMKEDRGYGFQQPSKPPDLRRESQVQYITNKRHEQQDPERPYKGKRPRSRSPRHGESRSRRRSYSRSSSCSRSYSSRSQSPSSYSYHRSRVCAARDREKMKVKREYSRRPRYRSCSSSSSRSRSSSRSFSVSPPSKRYHRRSSNISHPRSSYRHSSRSLSRHRSHSRGYSEHPKSYNEDYSKEYVTKENVKNYPKTYVETYSKEYVTTYPQEYVKEYTTASAKGYSKEVVIKKEYLKDHAKGYRHYPSSPERRYSQPQGPQFRRSPSIDRHQAQLRDYSRGDETWAPESRSRPISVPEKHRRSTRWQPRP
ncbi:hypothetical protein CCR75_004172 [Bremia lactucae]|uniref:Casein kinase I n=1 Tax=Bremia lactucae TaxID=4779 RepID=A0A976IEL1_BRELC|nr:hypothetical protein CCR75_004172 [Bremia lactucae]